MGADVVCHSCKGIYHELTDKYDPNKPLNGSMFKKKKNIDPTWFTFAEKETTQSGHLECPNCGSLYFIGGKLLLVGEAPQSKKRKSIPKEMNKTILELHDQGQSATQIAEAIGSSRQAVGRRLYDLGKGKSK